MKKETYILITGASGGIGTALVDYFLSMGKRNIYCHYYSNHETLFEVMKRHDIDPSLNSFKADLTNYNQISSAIDAIFKRGIIFSGLINLVGATSNSMAWKMEENDFKMVLEHNLFSVFNTCKKIIPQMRENNFGRIINFSSVVPHIGVIGTSHYSASKLGIEGYTKSISKELVSKNITVNNIALGYFNYGVINTIPDDIKEKIKIAIPMKRFGEIYELGAFLNLLLSKDSSYFTGQTLHINGGLY